MSRRAFTLVLALGVSACASPGIPPGGPPDKEAPQLLSVRPDTNSLNVRSRSVIFRFDEVINERSSALVRSSGGQGAAGGGGNFGSNGNASTLASIVSVSPGDGRERVTWHRDVIEVEPRNGFRPNTTYRVTILPGLGDLRGNVLDQRVEVVFSTGATTSVSSIGGRVFDWVEAKTAPNARVEVFAPTDTAFRWSARADSAGRFVVRDLAPGTYRLRGWLDANSNRSIDPREPFDSTTVTLDSALTTELYAFEHDTIGPRIETLEPIDSTALRVKFDRGVDVTWSPDSSTLVLMRHDSSSVRLGVMMPATRFDSLIDAERKATAAAAPADTAAPARAAAPAVAPAGIRPGRPGIDTIPPVRLNRPLPIQSWVVRFDAPISPGEYRLKVRAVRGLTGTVKGSEREFRLRPPPLPRDSTSNAKPPAATKPDTRPVPPRAPETRPRA